MSYKIKKLSDIKAFQIIVDGTLNQDKRKSLHLEVTSLLTANSYHRLLIDVRNSILSKDYSASDSIEMAKYMQKLDSQENTKIAFLSTNKVGTRKVFVNIAQVMGINIKHFTEFSEAKSWLFYI